MKARTILVALVLLASPAFAQEAQPPAADADLTVKIAFCGAYVQRLADLTPPLEQQSLEDADTERAMMDFCVLDPQEFVEAHPLK